MNTMSTLVFVWLFTDDVVVVVLLLLLLLLWWRGGVQQLAVECESLIFRWRIFRVGGASIFLYRLRSGRRVTARILTTTTTRSIQRLDWTGF
jgi:hypothetical protein